MKSPLKVLLAEDQAEMRALLCGMLAREGYEVVVAQDGPGLIETLIAGLTDESDAWIPDLIISDVRMPGFSGVEVLARLRRESWTTPVLLITAFGDDELREQVERLGAARVLDKPFELEVLRDMAREMIAPH
ncbi:response regulator [Vitiosangium sp. GDMCC 1.1324]|uniref:response regulator n=1 Tax=Vitiosangium sp. (strain GDMCC 1.1324) TaxID=2138576 RepID=UPI001E64383A|nr:response regulator [Vitiosangium sp. GDMCC 1.1324]